MRGVIGLDGGSTSSKCVFIDENGEILKKCYQLSKGNPIEDTIEILGKLRSQIESQGATIEVLGAATTGYAKDTLRDVIRADVALVFDCLVRSTNSKYDCGKLYEVTGT